MTAVFNFNVGLFGHIDSGKTSLAKALSTTTSTACFDKHPQSKQRGITLDLGFSSYTVELPAHLKDQLTTFSQVQYTLVDCPGHASLIRTVIGGSSIIDLVLLVVDVTKGMQTQTSECLVIAEITCQRLIVVLNKCDLLADEKRDSLVEKMSKRLQKILERTKFKGAPIVAASTKPEQPEGTTALKAAISEATYQPKRSSEGPFLMAIDHCFSVRGQGTVMTGTVLSGSVRCNDPIEIGALRETRKIKSMQMFRRPVETAMQGDRAGICVTQFDAKLMERGLIYEPGLLRPVHAFIIDLNRVPYFKQPILSKSKFHLFAGHEFAMATVWLFVAVAPSSPSEHAGFNWDAEYTVVDDSAEPDTTGTNDPVTTYALLQVDKPMLCVADQRDPPLVIGARLDSDIHKNVCRVAFHGTSRAAATQPTFRSNWLPQLKVFKTKVREGHVERANDPTTLIVNGLFKKDTDLSLFDGMRVEVTSSAGDGDSTEKPLTMTGRIDGGFGQSGKVKVRLAEDLAGPIFQALGAGARKKKAAAEKSVSPVSLKVRLTFRRYIFDKRKKPVQCD